MPNTPGYVYLLRSGTTPKYKIGITTRTVEQRVKELNRGQAPDPITAVHWIWTNFDCKTVESELHKYCKSRHHNGEWFIFSEGEVDQVIAQMNTYKSARSQPNNQQSQQEDYSYSGGTFYSSDGCLSAAFWIAIALGAFATFASGSNPKYSACIQHSGGAACEKLIQKSPHNSP
ncbi:MAG: GIY-YIG nuclease family protein [Gloeotrichia echinulata DVL01]